MHNCNIPVHWLILLCDYYFISHLVTDLPGLFCHSRTLSNKHVTFSLVLDNMALDLMWYVIVFNIISWSVSLYINRWFGWNVWKDKERCDNSPKLFPNKLFLSSIVNEGKEFGLLLYSGLGFYFISTSMQKTNKSYTIYLQCLPQLFARHVNMSKMVSEEIGNKKWLIGHKIKSICSFWFLKRKTCS